jgi:HlyD family secretion protein
MRRIVTAEVRDAVRVPVEALRYWPQATPKPAQNVSTPDRLWMLRAGRPVPVPVVIGLTDDTYAQVKQGDLSPGDSVIIGERAGSEPSTRSAAGNRPRAPFM